MVEKGGSGTAWKDSYTLLCESCGYVIEGLPEDGPCPECGRPMRDSNPERRAGTPWQRAPGLRAMAATWWMVLRHPCRTLDMVMVAPPRIGLLLVLAAFPIAWLCASALLLFFEREVPLAGGGSQAWSAGSVAGAWMLTLVIGVVLTPAVVAVLQLLTWIEARGLVLFGSRHGYRAHRELAQTIVRHGAVGWLLCGVGAALVLPLAWSMGIDWRMAFGEPRRFVLWMAFAGILVASFGFFGFEVFAWLGLRRCRFANRRPRPDASGVPQTEP